MKSTGRELKLEDILAPVDAAMARVDVRLSGVALPESGTTLGAVLEFSLEHTGKRIRPALVLLASGVYGRSSEAVIDLAAATECLHSATLMHDDIVDGAESRRGRRAVHVMWSHAAAVLTGDFLFAQAADLVAGLGRPRIVGMFADTIMQMCRSEFEAPVYRDRSDGMVQAYLAKIRGKTASLFALCCEASAELAEAGEENLVAMREFGMNLGLAFQIADDVMDVMGDEATTGKPVGNDLRQGLLTLPAIHYLQMNRPAAGPIGRLLEGPPASQAELDDALAELERSGAVAQAMRDAEAYARRARASAQRLPAGPYKTALEDLTHYVISRLF